MGRLTRAHRPRAMRSRPTAHQSLIASSGVAASFILEGKINNMAQRFLLALLMWSGIIGGSSGDARAEDFLDAEQAFVLSAGKSADAVQLTWQIAPGYHLYVERISIDSEPAGVLGTPRLPKGEPHFDKAMNRDMQILRGAVSVTVPLKPGARPVALLVTSQGCAEAGLCYPPQTTRLELAAMAAATPAQAGGVEAPDAVAIHGNAGDAGDDSKVEQLLRGGNRLSIAFAFFVFGLFLSFTPCVLPMVPILSSIIVGEKNVSKLRGLSLAASYSLGMALVYTAMGVAAGLAGEGLAAALQTPAVLITFAVLLVLLALSMFDVYQLQLPAALQSRLSDASGRVKGGRGSGVFLMGALSALIVGPCVAAPLAGALVYISQTKDVWIGALALFCMACGMSVPLLLTGVSAGGLLPRAGSWMNGVKKFFGVMLIAVAVWMVSPVLPGWAVMLAWGGLAIVVGVYLRAFDALPSRAGGMPRLGKGIGVMLVVLGVLQFIGVFSGGGDALQPLKHLAGSTQTAAARAGATERSPHGELFERVATGPRLQAMLDGTDKPIVLDLYADWCTSCKEMELTTFRDPRVVKALAGFKTIQVDVTANSEADRAFMKQYGLFGPPGILVLTREGKELRRARMVGYVPPDAFIRRIETAFEQAKLALLR